MIETTMWTFPVDWEHNSQDTIIESTFPGWRGRAFAPVRFARWRVGIDGHRLEPKSRKWVVMWGECGGQLCHTGREACLSASNLGNVEISLGANC